MAGPSARQVFTDPRFLIAFGFGSGLAPKAPGTAGSAVALVLFIPLLQLPVVIQLAFILIYFAVATMMAGQVAEELGDKDPGGIVCDEFVGMWITMLWLPNWWWLPIAFALFRLFDIFKPWPVSLADQELKGGLGIMMDDVIAGMYALVSLHGLFLLYGYVFLG